MPQIDVKHLIKVHKLPIVLALMALAIALAGDAVQHALRFDRDAISNGQWWRLITGNLAHLGWSHTALNLAGLALIWALLRHNFSTSSWTLICLISSLSVTLGLYYLNPSLHWYVGLSGLLHGLFVAGAIGSLRRNDRRDLILLIAIIAKLGWEQFSGPMPGTAEMAGGPVIVDSHLYGAIGGMIGAFLIKPQATTSPSSQ